MTPIERAAKILRAISVLVPATERHEWLREWEAEFAFHLRDADATQPAAWTTRRLLAAAQHATYLRFGRRQMPANRGRVWAGVTDDLRHAVRGAVRVPAFSATVVLTLALGVGLISAILAFADGYLFRPLPFPGAERAYYVRDPNGRFGQMMSAADARILRESALGEYGFVEWSLSSAVSEVVADGTPVPAFAYEVSPRFRETLELPLRAGRDFSSADHDEGAPVVAWVSHRFWRGALGGDPRVVGRVIPVKGPLGAIDMQIVGILGPEVATFDSTNEPPEFVVPARGRPREGPNRLAFPLVRLPGHITVEQATAQMTAILQSASPAADGRPRVVRLSSFDRVQRGGGAPTAKILFAGALLIMVLASLNLIHLLLGRGETRSAEAATRVALGASRWRVRRAFLVESFVLSIAGIGLGLIGGKVLSSLIASRIPELPTSGRNLAMMPVTFDGRVIVIAAAFGVVAAVAGGLWPARRAWRTSLDARVRGTTRRSARLARLILASELTVVTIVGAGAVFAGQGIYRYLNKPLGFDYTDRVEIGLQRAGARPSASDIAAALDAVKAVGGVRVAAADTVAMPGEEKIEIPGVAVDTGRVGPQGVPPGLFEAWGWQVVDGRWFDPREFGSSDVAVVNENFARLAWPGGGAVGAQIRTGPNLRTVVGVIAAHQWRLDMPLQPEVFVPASTGTARLPIVAWAPETDAADIQARIQAAVEAAVPGATVRARVLTFETYFVRGIGEARFQGPIVTTFAVLGALLAAIGVFGIVSFLVSQRTREFGIRVALGARRSDVRLTVIRESLMPALVGVAAGSLGAWALSQVVQSSVFGWEASGFQAVAVVIAAVLMVAVVAALAPAGRAARIDPAISLRE
jgi:predicted permease